MVYNKTIILKDGRECLLKNGTAADGAACLDLFLRTHEQTDFLASYPDECTMTAESESEFLQKASDSDNEIEILAVVNGQTVGSAGIEAHGSSSKMRHRANFGISVDCEYWGLGIGNALMDACLSCAVKAGYKQIELGVVATNDKAISLYQKKGFVEYGRNPKAFVSRHSGYQEMILMRKEL